MPVRFKVYINGIETPAQNLGSLKVVKEPFTENGAYQFRASLSGAIRFKGDAYATIKQITDLDICQTVSIRIDEICSPSVTEVLFSGIFTRANCTFFYDACAVEVEPEPEDEIYCLLKNYETGINILANAQPQSVDYIPVFGIEFGSAPCVTGSNINEWGGAEFAAGTGLYARIVVTNFCIAGAPVEPPPSNSPWFLLEDNCSSNGTATWGRRALPGVDLTSGISTTTTTCDALADPLCVPPYPTDPGNWFPACTYLVPGLPPENETIWVDFSSAASIVPLNNGRFLDQTISFILFQYGCGLTFASDLLQAPVNPVTLEANPNPSTLIYQKSDIVLANSSEPARLGSLSAKDLLAGLSDIFNAAWFIDPGTTVLRFEHISQVVLNTVTLDLTTYEGGIYARRKNTISFEKFDQPSAEVFKNATENQNLDFIGAPITYSLDCTSGENREIRAQVLDVELPRIFQNEEEGLDGFVLINGDAINYADTYSEPGELSGGFIPNAPLSFANLARDYYPWERILLEGELNNQPTIFNSTKPTKNQVEFEFPFCCFNNINPRELIRTEEGLGRIFKLEYDLGTRRVTVQLKFEL